MMRIVMYTESHDGKPGGCIGQMQLSFWWYHVLRVGLALQEDKEYPQLRTLGLRWCGAAHKHGIQLTRFEVTEEQLEELDRGL